MTFYADNETKGELPFDWETTFRLVGETVLELVGCPYEAQVSLLLTDNEGIAALNRRHRGKEGPTDVLSFPNLEFPRAADFSRAKEDGGCFEPDAGELMLGSIALSVDKALEQAAEYGHSPRREFAFLIAHSMLHLCGYDHESIEEEEEMSGKQEEALALLHITRE